MCFSIYIKCIDKIIYVKELYYCIYGVTLKTTSRNYIVLIPHHMTFCVNNSIWI